MKVQKSYKQKLIHFPEFFFTFLDLLFVGGQSSTRALQQTKCVIFVKLKIVINWEKSLKYAMNCKI